MQGGRVLGTSGAGAHAPRGLWPSQVWLFQCMFLLCLLWGLPGVGYDLPPAAKDYKVCSPWLSCASWHQDVTVKPRLQWGFPEWKESGRKLTTGPDSPWTTDIQNGKWRGCSVWMGTDGWGLRAEDRAQGPPWDQEIGPKEWGRTRRGRSGRPPPPRDTVRKRWDMKDRERKCTLNHCIPKIFQGHSRGSSLPSREPISYASLLNRWDQILQGFT